MCWYGPNRWMVYRQLHGLKHQQTKAKLITTYQRYNYLNIKELSISQGESFHSKCKRRKIAQEWRLFKISIGWHILTKYTVIFLTGDIFNDSATHIIFQVLSTVSVQYIFYTHLLNQSDSPVIMWSRLYVYTLGQWDRPVNKWSCHVITAHWDS